MIHFWKRGVHAVLLGQLLGFPSSRATGSEICDIIQLYINANRQALTKVNDALAIDRNALLVDSISDFYELPIRISDILGQCALLFFGQRTVSQGDSDLVTSVIRRILARYGNSILALTDDQATGYLLFLELCRRENWLEFGEEVIGRLYHDLHKISRGAALIR